MVKPDRNERLAQQLRANLKKRKAQMRAREAQLRSREPVAGDQKPVGGGADNRPAKMPKADQSKHDED